MPANIVVPEVGESIVDARVAKWLKKEGDVVSAGDPVVELETDKIDLEVAAPQAGVLRRIDHTDGADVKVGEVLGVIDESASAEATADKRGAKAGASSASATAAADKRADAQGASFAEAGESSGARPAAKAAGPAQPQAAQPGSAAQTADSDRLRATPTARKAAQQNEVDLKQVRGSGDAGRVMRRDVEQAAQGAPARGQTPSAQPAGGTTAMPAAPAPQKTRPATPVSEDRRRSEGERAEERVRMSKRRATIARRLVEAQSTAAMLTTFNEVDMSGVMALRERHKQSFKDRHGVGLGLSSFFVKALVGALRDFQRINAEIKGDEMVLKHY
jgi:2-oxoglutarate dehydrogenase E2 component (dihydrolipoamide succinyltransferase)